jgi:hypothetical protein
MADHLNNPFTVAAGTTGETFTIDLSAVAAAVEHLAPDVPADTVEPPPPAASPVPMIEGTFAIYNDGAGGIMIVTDVSGQGVERRHFPAKIVKMAKKFAGGMIPGLGI